MARRAAARFWAAAAPRWAAMAGSAPGAGTLGPPRCDISYATCRPAAAADLAGVSAGGGKNRRSRRRVDARSSELDSLDADLLPQVCLVGRPNVGKSALYNRLVRRKEALVFDTPGSHVTRDYREGVGQLGDMGRAAQLTGRMMQRSDVTLFMLDAREGLLPADEEIANWMRANIKSQIIVTANKCERRTHTGEAENAVVLAEAEALGLGEPVAISAAHGEGMADLYAALQPYVDAKLEHAKAAVSEAQLADMDTEIDLKAHPLKMALVGLPNVGKSTLCNVLAGEERSLTGPEPGLTRDSVRARFDWEGWRVHLVDTAGWMRGTRLDRYDDVGGAVAKMAAMERQRSLRLSHVVGLVVDAHAAAAGTEGLTRRELSMASEVVEEGRGLVLVLNKADLLPPQQREKVLARLQAAVRESLPQVPGVACLWTSATTGEGLGALMPAMEATYLEWNRRIGTGELNRWMAKFKARQAGSGSSTGLAKIKYITQIKRRPPTFSAFLSGSKVDAGNSATRFLTNAIREDYGIFSVPLRIFLRASGRDRPPPSKSKSKRARR
eukprot:jgi/Tetstr1/422097/TSEL_012955.t1